jgi:hypothetical protein
MMEATLSSMTHKVLSLVQRRRWKLFGTSFKRSLLQPSWRISCMQFGILTFALYLITNHTLIGTVYQWTVLAPSYLQSLSSSIKGQEKVTYPVVQLQIINTFTVPLVAVFTKFDGQIIQESGQLDDMDYAVKWDRANINAEITFQRVYLPKVFGTNYPPKAYVCLGGGDH